MGNHKGNSTIERSGAVESIFKHIGVVKTIGIGVCIIATSCFLERQTGGMFLPNAIK
jgi:hypothetical protein